MHRPTPLLTSPRPSALIPSYWAAAAALRSSTSSKAMSSPASPPTCPSPCISSSLGEWVVGGADPGQHPRSYLPAPVRWVALLPLVILFGTALFTIRGYAITSEAILVDRLLWSTSLPRRGLVSAQVEPDAMRGSLRTFRPRA